MRCIPYILLTALLSLESPLTPARNRKSLRRTGSDSPTTLLKTISEIPTTNLDDEQGENLEDADPLQSEEGSSSSIRSGESGIDMADGFFSFGKKQGSKRAGLQNGNQSPGTGTEHLMTSTPRDPKSKSKLEFCHSPSPSKEGNSLTKSAEWMHCKSPPLSPQPCPEAHSHSQLFNVGNGPGDEAPPPPQCVVMYFVVD